MTEPAKGQVWRGKDGMWRIDHVDERGLSLIVHDDAEWEADDPRRVTMVVDRAEFLARHRLEQDEDGAPVPPPAFDPRPGDVVRLRCGGPPMVVVEVIAPAVESPDQPQDGWVRRNELGPVSAVCMWHMDTGALCRTGIPVHCLTAADEQPPAF